MKAVVFAAGVGSRLKPFTDVHPKALAPIAGKPILGHVLDKLIAAGADDIVVNVHHFADQVISYLSANYPAVGYSDESTGLLDTAGGLAKIFREKRFKTPLGAEEAVIVHNADIITDFPMAEMISRHKEGSATILVDPERNSSRKLLLEGDRMVGWENLKTGEIRPAGVDIESSRAAAFGGVHILSGALMADINDFAGSELKPCSITDFYISACSSREIVAYTPSAPFRWFDIGTVEKLEAARKSFE